MNEFFEAFTDMLSAVFDLPIFRFALCLFPIVFIGPVFRMMFEIIDYTPDFFGFFVDLWDWLSDKIITWLCSNEKGFQLAYKLGWARSGVDFFDCGQDCDKCPKYSQCHNELRSDLGNVTQNQDPDAGSCS